MEIATIYLDKQRTIKFDLDFLFQENDMVTLKENDGNFTLKDTVGILLAGLIHEDLELNADKLLKIIYESKIPIITIFEAVGNAWDEINIKKGKFGHRESILDKYLKRKSVLGSD
ncbi:MAG: hypothetical protein JJE17_01750 [Peptostreptococcaceae bacterium]|nr:hypothetical protein [Peptostreptococcaceae bacterium]